MEPQQFLVTKAISLMFVRRVTVGNGSLYQLQSCRHAHNGLQPKGQVKQIFWEFLSLLSNQLRERKADVWKQVITKIWRNEVRRNTKCNWWRSLYRYLIELTAASIYGIIRAKLLKTYLYPSIQLQWRHRCFNSRKLANKDSDYYYFWCDVRYFSPHQLPVFLWPDWK